MTTNAIDQQVTQQPPLSGLPLPLLVELRRLSEARRQENYNILSFLTEVVLKREGIEVPPQMFKELLTRRTMLLLFDGLDEVATVDERIGLVEEIEHFVQSYPGNRVVVTSRPAGYDLARFSYQSFAHTLILPFDNAQIYQFLQNWYTSVLGLSPISQADQQELDRLIELLQNNTRLHMLAENPLLLTVITALHRYERLPDKRVLIYDRCADLLLETWAKIKGTHIRWEKMKLVKEDQYACLAHLGFILHSQDQEEKNEDAPFDVTARVMMREVERFLKDGNLIVEGAELRFEAKSFIELIQVEAGLIVERGTEENGEVLYGFVHRTFQEYFAAAYIYEEFQQLVDITVVRDFLQEHLHDPHWHEVTLLLLAKLKSKPVSDLLRQLLQGVLITKRSQATDVLQQDLFFSCDCLAEEIVVENDVAQLIITRLEEIIKKSGSLLQRKKALMSLCVLMKTRQYANHSRKTIIDLAVTDGLLELPERIEVLQILFATSSSDSEENQLALDTLTSLLQRPGMSFEQTFLATKSLYKVSSTLSEEEVVFVRVVERLAPFLFSLYPNVIDLMGFDHYEPEGSRTMKLALDTLTSLLQRPGITFEQSLQAIALLVVYRLTGSEENQLALDTLTSLLQRPGITFEQSFQVTALLVEYRLTGSEERQMALDTLTSLLQHPGITFEQSCLAATSLVEYSLTGSKERQLALDTLTSLLQRPGITFEQSCLIVLLMTLYYGPSVSEERQMALDTLTSLLQRPGITFEQTFLAASQLVGYRSIASKEKQLALDTLTSLLQRPGITFEQTFQVALLLAVFSSVGSKEERLATNILISSVQDANLVEDEGELVYSLLSRMVPQFDRLKSSPI